MNAQNLSAPSLLTKENTNYQDDKEGPNLKDQQIDDGIRKLFFVDKSFSPSFLSFYNTSKNNIKKTLLEEPNIQILDVLSEQDDEIVDKMRLVPCHAHFQT